MYHKNCLSNYLRKFERKVEMIMNPPLDSAENVEITNTSHKFVRTINIKNHPYFSSDCRNSFNGVLNSQGMNRYFFINPVGTGMSPGRPIQGLFDVATLQNTSQEDPNETNFVP